MTITLPRALRVAVLMLAALCVLSSAAEAGGPAQKYAALLPASSVGCPCNAGLPVGQAVVVRPSCPCNAGLPDGLSRPVPASQSGSDPNSDSPHGGAAVRTAARRLVPPAISALNSGLASAPSRPGRSFDWSAAGVGAGLAAGIGLLLAGGAWRLGRRRPRAQVPVS